MEDNNPKEPGWLSYAVISVWVLIAIIVVIVILASNPNQAKAIELIVQLVAALSGAAAAIAAFLAARTANETLKQARADKEAEAESKRPKFRLEQDYLQVITHVGDEYSINPYYELRLLLKNIHSHPATNIRLECKVLQGDKKLLDEVSAPVGEIDWDDSFAINHAIDMNEIADDWAFVRLRLTYIDALTRKEHSQLLYRKFYGPYKYDGLVRADLLDVDHSEWRLYLETHQKIVEARNKKATASQR
jgi:hypothetical protein